MNKESGTPKLDETLPNFIKRKHPRKGEKRNKRAMTKVQASKHGGKGTTKYLNCTGKMIARLVTTEPCGLGLCYLIATKQGVCHTVALPFTFKEGSYIVNIHREVHHRKKAFALSIVHPTFSSATIAPATLTERFFQVKHSFHCNHDPRIK
jgi:hypothetical protein